MKKTGTLNVELADRSTGAQSVRSHARVLADIFHVHLMNIQHGQAVLVPEIILFIRCVEFHIFVIPVDETICKYVKLT